MSAAVADPVPLFPLQTVLFPGGALPLRIFEPRYVDMVGRCLREGREFGVVPILRGQETGAVPEFHPGGTLAGIESWDQGDDGLLHLLVRGTARFQVRGHAVQGDGLIVGEVTPLDEPAERLPDAYGFLGDLLDQVFESRPELAPPRPWPRDQATWVAYRCAELLPLALEMRVQLLELASATEKLRLVARFVAADR